MFISVIIPAYNEERRIVSTVETIKGFLDSKNILFEIIISDDGSKDNTPLLAQKMGGADDRISLVRAEKNQGKGAAVKAGMLKAKGTVLFTTDADLSTPIQELEKLLAGIRSGCDVVIGSRRVSGARISVHQHWLRENMGKGFTLLSRFLLVPYIRDYTCGFKAFQREAGRRLFQNMRIHEWSYDAEILFQAHLLGYKIRQVPVEWADSGSTRVRLFRDAFKSFLGLLRIRWNWLRGCYATKRQGGQTGNMATGLILVLALSLSFTGIWWGLPSHERNALYFTSPETIRESVKNISEEDVRRSMEKDSPLKGMVFNPIRSYHPDESNFIKSVSNMSIKPLNLNPHYFHYGTLYIYIYAFWLWLAAMVRFILPVRDLTLFFLHPSEIAKFYLVGRFLSALSCAGAVWLTYRLGKDAYGKKAGQLAAFFLALCPLLVINAHYLSVDTTALFFLLLSFFFCVRGLNTGLMKWYLLAGLSAGLAADTKYTAGLIILMIPAVWILSRLNMREGVSRHSITWIVYSFLLSALAFLILCPFVFTDRAEFKSFFIDVNLSAALHSQVASPGWVFYLSVLFHGIGMPLLLLGSLGILLAVKKHSKMDLLILCWIILSFIFFSAVKFRHDRFILPILPFLCLLAGKVGVEIFNLKLLKQAVFRGIAFAGISLIAVFTLLLSSSYNLLMLKVDIRTAAGYWVAENIPAGSRIGIPYPYYQFTTPPLNLEKYKIVKLENNPELLESEKPDYVILSNLHFNTIATRYTLENTPDIFTSNLRNSDKYKLVKRFSRPPLLFGRPVNPNPSHDYLYLYPDFFIWKKN